MLKLGGGGGGGGSIHPSSLIHETYLDYQSMQQFHSELNKPYLKLICNTKLHTCSSSSPGGTRIEPSNQIRASI